MAEEICLIATHHEFMEKIKNIIEENHEDIGVYTATLEDAAILCRQLMEAGTKIFISRGGNRKYIEKQLGVPVVDINYNIGDYVAALEIAKDVKGRVGIFSYEKKLEDIDTVGRLLNIDIHHYIFSNKYESRNCVLQAQRDGIVLGIGGAVTGGEAKKIGLKYITVESSKDSIINAIANAKQLLRVKKEESEEKENYKLQMERYMAILNFTHDAIVAIDEDCRVSVVNPVAEKLLGITADEALGSYINEALPFSRLLKVMETGLKEINDIIEFKKKLIYTNRIPIIIDGRVKGVVATFQDVNTIQESEQKIRVKLHQKGLVAKYDFNEVIGESNIIKKTINIAKSYAKTTSTVLISGETGTGKELFAQSIHNSSNRRRGPFVAINCAALPKNLLESELFGYETGTFTGAVKGGKIGLFELAHKGTIFLDEIGEIPLEVQAQLLRVLQEKEIRRLGSDRLLPVDVRVIAATNKSLEEEVHMGRFREDLFYRINVLRLQLPPLRQRGEDIVEIAKALLKELDYQFYTKNYHLWDEICNELLKYPWHGNVRELQNVLERIIVILKGKMGDFKNHSALIRGLMVYKGEESVNSLSRVNSEKELLIKTLVNNNWCKQKSANELGVSRTTLWRKLKNYNIDV